MAAELDFERLFECAPTSFAVLDRSLRIVAVNRAFVAASGRTREQLIGSDVFDAFRPNPSGAADDGVQALRASLQRVLATGRADVMGYTRYDLDGPGGFERRYWSPVNSPLLDASGDVELIIHRADDVTGVVHARDRLLDRGEGDALDAVGLGLVQHAHDVEESNRGLREATRRLERIAAQQAIVAELGQLVAAGGDPEKLIEQAATAVCRLPHIRCCEVVERLDGMGLRVRVDDGGQLDAGLGEDTATLAQRALEAVDPVVIAESASGDRPGMAAAGAGLAAGSAMAARIGDGLEPFGAVIVYSGSRGTFGPEDGSFLTVVANLLAVGVQRARRDEEMRQLALHDDLTGLPNRKLLLDRLHTALSRARREGGTGALALLDLDGFKAVNDTLGHQAGDAVLRQVGASLTAVLRDSDTVARLGGDEFGLLLPEVATEAEAHGLALKLLGAVRQRVEFDGREFGMDASVGLALYPLHGDDEGLLLRRADAAMYVAKRGGGGHAIYTAEHDDFHHRRRGQIADLRRAIEGTELTLHYQPKISLTDGSVCGLEALVRWTHPQRGVVAPGDFIPLAEESGLIRTLTLRVVTTALEQARRWRDAGIGAPVSINLSSESLHDPELIPMLLGALERAGLTPDALELEVAESAFMKRPGAAMAVIGDLADAGIRTSMDAFGTGHSSLAYLERLPLHELKIDKSFLLDPQPGTHDATMVDAVIGLAHTFDLAVVGGGIESREVCHALRRRGCDRGQGFHLQAPLPGDEMTAWLRTRRFDPTEGVAPDLFY